MLKIKGKNINLRPVENDDAESLCENLQDREISEFTFIPYPYKLKDALEFIQHVNESMDSQKEYHLSIEDNATGKIIGGIGLNSINKYHKRAEFGYWIGKKYWNRGYVSEAVSIFVPHCFKKFELIRMQAYVRPENGASIRILEKYGFKNEGLLRRHHYQNGAHRDFYIYSILKDEIN